MALSSILEGYLLSDLNGTYESYALNGLRTALGGEKREHHLLFNMRDSCRNGRSKGLYDEN